MSFECKYLNKGFCELRQEKCDPGTKGCILKHSGAKFVKAPDTSLINKKNKRNSVNGQD